MKSIIIHAIGKGYRFVYICAVLLLLLCSTAFAQYENNNWAFGNKWGLSFATQPASFLPSQVYAPFRSATVSDANGNLLFYTNGTVVWDQTNNIMPHGDSIIHTNSAIFPDGGEAFIVPDPGNAAQYYVFTGPLLSSYSGSLGNPSPSKIRYSKVDMSLNGGLGDVLPNFKDRVLDSNACPVIAVAGYGMCDKWLVMHLLYSNQFKAYHITASGIDAPVVSTAGDSVKVAYANMKFASNNQRLVLRSDDLQAASFIEAFDFNYQTGVVSNPVMVEPALAGGISAFQDATRPNAIELSSDSKKLYSTVNTDSNFTQKGLIYQYDLSLPTAIDIQNSKTLVGIIDSVREIQLTGQNNIYISTGYYGNNIAAILYPNKEAQACGLVNNYITMPNGDSNFYYSACMANLVPVSHVIYNNSEEYACQYPSQLTAQVPSAGGYIWNTGATTQSININQPGTYWVKSSQTCGAWRIDTFQVHSITAPAPIPDSISCNGQPVKYTLHTPGSITWSDGTHDSVFTATQTGTYWVQTRIGQCTFRDTFRITIYPPSNISLLPADTTICNAAMSATITAGGNFNNYLWNTGATTANIQITQPGKYWVSATTPCGIYSDTMFVHFCPPVITDFTTAKDTICSGSCISFQASFDHNPTQFDWYFAGGNPATITGNQSPLVCYDTAGTFKASLVVSNDFGADTAAFFITVLPKPNPRFRDTIIVTPYKTELNLPACAAAAETDWYDENNNLVCSNCAALNLLAKDWQKNYYCVTRNADCADTCFYKITVTNIPSDAWLPDAFTPNGDGLNDYFHLITDNPNIKVADLAVYDRWGNSLYHSQENTIGWDGTYNGKQAQGGVYFWYLRYWVLGAGGEQKMHTSKGDVTLIR
ncbi:T9SS type B sorting domain-containing protein [Taibaiella soli]|nr:gliding motility-associated C-terminal domain-containing protein [Taibaiella soli]